MMCLMYEDFAPKIEGFEARPGRAGNLYDRSRLLFVEHTVHTTSSDYFLLFFIDNF